MDRHVGSEPVGHPRRQGVDLGVGVIEARDEQVRDLEPDGRLVLQVLERLEHRREPPGAGVGVEALREALEVDVRRVHVLEELDPRLGADVAGRHRDCPDPAFAARVRDVDRVLEEHDRVVVGEGDARAREHDRRIRDRLW